jgi:hypothetical protein
MVLAELCQALNENSLEGIKERIRPAANGLTDAAEHFLCEARTVLEIASGSRC